MARFERYGAKWHSAKVLARGSHAEMIALMCATDRDSAGVDLMENKVSP